MLTFLQQWLQRHQRIRRGLQIARLGLFQFGMGVSLAPITGTLNRVLINELRIPAVVVGFLLAIHYFVSPVWAMIGFHSDQQRAAGNWRTPYLIFGSMLTYGGLACAPFALILLGGDGVLPFWAALLVCTLIFLAYGIGVNIAETTYLALVRDITPPAERGQVLATLWTMLVLGTVTSALVIGRLLVDYNHVLLIRVMQGSAVIFLALAVIAVWNQEHLLPSGKLALLEASASVRLSLRASVRLLWQQQPLRLLFLTLFLATSAFSVHDVLLEPYGGEILHLSVTATTYLTALWGLAMLLAIGIAGLLLWHGASALWLIGAGCLAGGLGFSLISAATNAALVRPFYLGIGMVGIGRGLFIVGSLALMMAITDQTHAGLFLGLWGVMQALAQGVGTIGSSLARDLIQAATGEPWRGYSVVYMAAVASLLLVLLVLVLRLATHVRALTVRSPWTGLHDLPADQILS